MCIRIKKLLYVYMYIPKKFIYYRLLYVYMKDCLNIPTCFCYICREKTVINHFSPDHEIGDDNIHGKMYFLEDYSFLMTYSKLYNRKVSFLVHDESFLNDVLRKEDHEEIARILKSMGVFVSTYYNLMSERVLYSIIDNFIREMYDTYDKDDLIDLRYIFSHDFIENIKEYYENRKMYRSKNKDEFIFPEFLNYDENDDDMYDFPHVLTDLNDDKLSKMTIEDFVICLEEIKEDLKRYFHVHTVPLNKMR